MAAVRQPAVAGQFYPGAKAGLEKSIAAVARRDLKREDAVAAVCPHAGYVYSGPVAGKVLSRVKSKQLFVIIGPNHTGMGRPFSIYSGGPWSTPLGEVEIDSSFSSHLKNNSSLFQHDNAAHTYEHSIEVQVPFLQYLMEDFKIVPICVASQDLAKLKQAGNDLAAAAAACKNDLCIIASSDMTHYEPHEAAKAKDGEALKQILNLDEDGLFEKVQALDISMCGVAPVIITIVAAKLIGAKKATLVDYMTSGETSGDYSSVVGYGGVIIT